MDTLQTIEIKGRLYERTEDDKRIYFKEISDRKVKANFSFSKDAEKNKRANDGLKMFWTSIYS